MDPTLVGHGSASAHLNDAFSSRDERLDRGQQRRQPPYESGARAVSDPEPTDGRAIRLTQAPYGKVLGLWRDDGSLADRVSPEPRHLHRAIRFRLRGKPHGRPGSATA